MQQVRLIQDRDGSLLKREERGSSTLELLNEENDKPETIKRR